MSNTYTLPVNGPVTTKEEAVRLKKSERYLWDLLRRQPELPPGVWPLGRQYRIDPEPFEAWLRAGGAAVKKRKERGAAAG